MLPGQLREPLLGLFGIAVVECVLAQPEMHVGNEFRARIVREKLLADPEGFVVAAQQIEAPAAHEHGAGGGGRLGEVVADAGKIVEGGLEGAHAEADQSARQQGFGGGGGIGAGVQQAAVLFDGRFEGAALFVQHAQAHGGRADMLRTAGGAAQVQQADFTGLGLAQGELGLGELVLHASGGGIAGRQGGQHLVIDRPGLAELAGGEAGVGQLLPQVQPGAGSGFRGGGALEPGGGLGRPPGLPQGPAAVREDLRGSRFALEGVQPDLAFGGRFVPVLQPRHLAGQLLLHPGGPGPVGNAGGERAHQGGALLRPARLD